MRGHGTGMQYTDLCADRVHQCIEGTAPQDGILRWLKPSDMVAGSARNHALPLVQDTLCRHPCHQETAHTQHQLSMNWSTHGQSVQQSYTARPGESDGHAAGDKHSQAVGGQTAVLIVCTCLLASPRGIQALTERQLLPALRSSSCHFLAYWQSPAIMVVILA